MINWPCLFKLEGDDELIFLNSEVELHDECESLIWSDNDILIDSSGNCFSLLQKSPNLTGIEQVNVIKLKKQYNLTELTQLIQAHEFSKASMCLSKIQFSSIKSAVSALSEH